LWKNAWQIYQCFIICVVSENLTTGFRNEILPRFENKISKCSDSSPGWDGIGTFENALLKPEQNLFLRVLHIGIQDRILVCVSQTFDPKEGQQLLCRMCHNYYYRAPRKYTSREA